MTFVGGGTLFGEHFRVDEHVRGVGLMSEGVGHKIHVSFEGVGEKICSILVISHQHICVFLVNEVSLILVNGRHS